MKRKNRIVFFLVVILSGCLLLGYGNSIIRSITAIAHSQEISSGAWKYELDENNKVIITEYLGDDKELTIDKIDGKEVVAIGENAFQDNESITKVELAQGIERIEDSAFRRSGLESIIIPNSITQIGMYAFSKCAELEKISVGDCVTEIGAHAFVNTSYYLNETNWENNVCYLGKYALGCKSVKSITIKEGCVLLADSFSSENSILEVVFLPDSMEIIGEHAFDNAGESLKKVVGGKNIKRIGAFAFAGLQELESIYIQGENIYIEESAFISCASLETIVVDASYAEFGESCFTNTSDLTTLVIPNLNCSLDEMFFNVYELLDQNIHMVITNMESDQLKENQDYFLNLEGMDIYLNNEEEDFSGCTYEWLQDNNLFYKGQFSLCKYIIDSWIMNVYIVENGGAVSTPYIKNGMFSFYSEGAVYGDIAWDYTGDGVADKVPETITSDTEAHAIYSIIEESIQTLPTLSPVTPSPSATVPPSSSATVPPSPCATVPISPDVTVTEGPTPTSADSVSKKPEASPIPTDITEQTSEPAVSMIPTPIESSGAASTGTENVQQVENASLQVQLKIKKETKVSVEWTCNQKGEGYEIYRSRKKETGFQKIKKVSATKNKFVDKTVLAGRKYYYKVECIIGKGNGEESRVRSDIYTIYVPRYQSPEISVTKKSVGQNIKYIQITLKKYVGSKVEIQYRKDNKKYKNISLVSSDIKKMNGKFRIQYLSSKENLSIRVRTYSLKKKEKEYSKWSKVKRIKT